MDTGTFPPIIPTCPSIICPKLTINSSENDTILKNCPSEQDLLNIFVGQKPIIIDENLGKKYVCLAQVLRNKKLDLCLSNNTSIAVGLGFFLLFLVIILGFMMHIYYKHKDKSVM